jgi:hypothetical protein
MLAFLVLVLFALFAVMRGEIGTYLGFATASGKPVAGWG